MEKKINKNCLLSSKSYILLKGDKNAQIIWADNCLVGDEKAQDQGC